MSSATRYAILVAGFLVAVLLGAPAAHAQQAKDPSPPADSSEEVRSEPGPVEQPFGETGNVESGDLGTVSGGVVGANVHGLPVSDPDQETERRLRRMIRRLGAPGEGVPVEDEKP